MHSKLLTPAEAVLLLAPKSGTANRCVQAGLLSLLSAGRIAIEQASGPLNESALLLHPPTDGARAQPGHLAALESALANHGKGNRLVSSEVRRALQSRFGYGYGRYLHEEVAPGLIECGLLIRTDGKWLGLFPRIGYQRTSRGDAVVAPLESLMSAVETLHSIIKKDPEQAIRLARSAGMLLVMSPKARRQIPALRKLLAERGEDWALPTHFPIESEREHEWEADLELADIARALDIGRLFDGLDAVAEFTGGGDGGSSDGGGDGGGGGD